MHFQSTNIWSRSWNYILDGTFVFVAFCGLMVMLSLIHNFVLIIRKKQGFVSGNLAKIFFALMPLIIVASLSLELWWRIDAFYGVSTFYVSYWWKYLAFSGINYSIILVTWFIKALYTKKFKDYKQELIEIKNKTFAISKNTIKFFIGIWKCIFRLFSKLFKLSSLKSKALDLVKTPMDGQIIELEKVGDKAFAQGHLGQGFAIIPKLQKSILTAPLAGTIKTIFHTLHAYGIESKNGTYVLVHIGLNTTKLKGKHFEVIQKIGAQVNAGDPVMKVDFKKIKAAGYDITTIVVCTKETKGKVNIKNSKLDKQISANTTIIKIT